MLTFHRQEAQARGLQNYSHIPLHEEPRTPPCEIPAILSCIRDHDMHHVEERPRKG